VTLLEDCVRKDLDTKAPRTMAVIEPLKVRITNLDKEIVVETPLFPKHPDAGTRKVTLEQTIFIEKKDFREIDDPDFFGLAPGKEVGLKYCGLIKCEKVVKDENGSILELECTYSSEVKKIKGRIHWIGLKDSVRATINMYDYLFSTDEVNLKQIIEEINPSSLIVFDRALVHKSVANNSLKNLMHFQFERKGYFVVDKDTNVEVHRFVFNFTVS